MYTMHTTSYSTLTQTTANQFPVFNFTLAGSSALTIWDQYRIDAIRFTIAPQNKAIGLFTTGTTLLGAMLCVIDYDDSTALTSNTQALGYNNCVVINPSEDMTRVFQPRAALAAYAGAFTNFANVGGEWFDAVSTGVQHYGIKLVIQAGMVGQTQFQVWDVVTEYFLSFRDAL